MLVVDVRAKERMNRVERIRNILWVCHLCTFFSLVFGTEHASEVQRLLLTNFARPDSGTSLFQCSSQNEVTTALSKSEKYAAVTVLF